MRNGLRASILTMSLGGTPLSSSDAFHQYGF